MSEPGSEHGTSSPGNEVRIDPAAWADIDALADTVREGFHDCDCRVAGTSEQEDYNADLKKREAALGALTARAKQEIEAHRLTAQAAARAEAEVERLTALVAFAREIYEAEASEWARWADPSDPDEALPPWQGKWMKFAEALAGKERPADAQIGEATGREMTPIEVPPDGTLTIVDGEVGIVRDSTLYDVCPQCGGRGTESRSWDDHPEPCPGCEKP